MQSSSNYRLHPEMGVLCGGNLSRQRPYPKDQANYWVAIRVESRHSHVRNRHLIRLIMGSWAYWYHVDGVKVEVSQESSTKVRLSSGGQRATGPQDEA